jgi:hypothetical protein
MLGDRQARPGVVARPSSGASLRFAAFGFLLALVSLAAQAVTVNDLYEVTLPIQGNREAAFVEALKVVAVRVSGRRDAPARLAASVNNARQYVQRFSFTADNQLQVAFDTGSVDRLLGEASLPTWGRERPATLVLLNAPAGDGTPMWIEASYPAPERDILSQAAKQRGVPLVWATLDGQDRSMLGAGSSAPSELLSLAARHNANAVLIGQGRRDGTGYLIVHWTLVSDEGAAEASGSLEDGVHLIADTFGRIYAASAGSMGSVNVEVSGIRNLDDYAATMNYLEGMTLVRSVAVEQVSGETMRFQLAVRGDATTLRRALALDNKLVPVSDESGVGTDRLQLRLQR